MVSAVRASSFACDAVALLFWDRNDGMAIAARMPMIRITTKKLDKREPTLVLERWRSRLSIFGSPGTFLCLGASSG